MNKETHDNSHIEFFDHLARLGKFDHHDFIGQSKLKNQLSDLNFHFDSPVSIIDLGCGAGRNLPVIREFLPARSRYTGIDYAPSMIDRANSRVKSDEKLNVKFLVGDAHNIPVDSSSADSALLISTFNHLYDKQSALSEISRILKPDAVLLIIHPKSLSETNMHHSEMPEPVSTDMLPGRKNLETMIRSAGFELDIYLDDENGYRVRLSKL